MRNLKMENIYKQLRENTETIRTPALTQAQLSNVFKREGNPVAQSVISKLETSKKIPPTTSFEVVKAYSTHFKVTSDYLLGLREVKQTDENIAMINKATGLSEQAIETLKMLKENNDITNALSTLNLLMNDTERFTTLLCNIDTMLNPEAYQTCAIAYIDNSTKCTIKNVLKSDECFAFIKKDAAGNSIGALEIDSTILPSHAYQKLKDVILEYKGK